MKRILVLAASGLLLLSVLAGCGTAKPAATVTAGQQNQSATPTLDKIKKDGKLVIGTSPDYPPFESLDNQNNVIGFDIDIMNEVAKKLGVKLEVVQMNFDSLIAGLTSNKFDIMAAGVSVTEDRKKQVDFSVPYLVGSDAIVVNKDIKDPITKLEDLKGKTVAVQLGTVQSDRLKKVGGITVKEFDLFTQAAAAVSSKQADAMYLAKVVAEQFVKKDPNLKIAAETPADDTAYALRKNTPDLTAVVNQTITDLQKSGQFDQLVQKWFK